MYGVMYVDDINKNHSLFTHVGHELQQSQDEVGMSPEDVERLSCQVLELVVVLGVDATHCFHHGLRVAHTHARTHAHNMKEV